MDVTTTDLPGVLLVRPRVFRDSRGSFLESWHGDRYARAGIPATFVQDNAASSRRGVIRGLHYQYPEPQGKLVMVLLGTVLDVVVDIRQGSPAFGKWLGAELSSENGHQLWIPEGFAHGYAVLSDSAVVAYKCTRSYNPAGDAAIRYNDPALGIDWGVVDPILSDRDLAAPLLSDVPLDCLPRL
jgi:dTDP-4-dehydrorhamnose 3,5-epimerase